MSAEVDAMARVLMAAWEKAEGRPVSASYVATFADMARAALADSAGALAKHDAEVLPNLLHEKTKDFDFMLALQREETRWRRGSGTRSLAHLRNVMHSVARVLDGHAAASDEAEQALTDHIAGDQP